MILCTAHTCLRGTLLIAALLLLVASPLRAGNNSGQAFAIWPDTGQNLCYNDVGNPVSCPWPGDPFYGQDGQYDGPARSYTKLDAAGNPLADFAPAWAMVRDNVTGLVWEVKEAGSSGKDYANPHDKDNTYTWCDTNAASNGGNQGSCGASDTEDFLAALNSGAGFGGFTDWRLPTLAELKSLVHRGRVSPAVDIVYFQDGVLSGYWTATTDASSTARAWRVTFSTGSEGTLAKSNSVTYVRAVRGGQVLPGNRFVAGSDTVTDTATCLEWQRATADPSGDGVADLMTWEQALAYAEGLSLDGKDDWRLPDANELASLVDYSRFNPAIDVAAFPDTPSSYYWTSTTSMIDPGSALAVYFYYGYNNNGYKPEELYSVRAVRGSQCSAAPQSEEWQVAAAVGANGTLDAGTPSPRTVAGGGTVQFTFHADPGYHVAAVSGCGISYSNSSNAVTSYTATTAPVSGDCEVAATFARNRYEVTAIAGAGGSLDPGTPSPQLADLGTTVDFTFHAAAGHHLAAVSGCGISIANDSAATRTVTTAPITGDCTVSATFTVDQFQVAAQAGAGGSVAAWTPSPRTVDYGDVAQFAFIANPGYHLVGIWGCGLGYTNVDILVTSYTATTAAIVGDCTVSAAFAINRYRISAAAGANGTVSPAGSVLVAHGDSQTFFITPAAHYQVADVLVDGASVGAVTAYTFVSVTGDHTFAASFAPSEHYRLTVVLAGKGAGSVTSAPAGIECPGVCASEFAHDEFAPVALTALPEQGSTFAGWSGDCAGTEPTCLVTMNQARSVTANFYRFPWPMFLPAITANGQRMPEE